jgi:hypothetical protein
MDWEAIRWFAGTHPHGFLSAKLAAIRHITTRLQPHFRKIGDNALLLTGLENVFAVKYYKNGRGVGLGAKVREEKSVETP